MLRTLLATRYVTPLREGGSLPAIVEAEDQGLYVMKFRGAGQGRKALVAELIAGELARALGLRVPELVLASLDPALGRAEPDTEIRELLKKSAGLNLALDYLPGSVTFDPLACPTPSAQLASDIVWLDAYLLNVDRTARNANLLSWHGRLFLIDHGAALYFHHAWEEAAGKRSSPFAPIRDHVLLPFAADLEGSAAKLPALVTPALLQDIVSWVPDVWLEAEPGFGSPDDVRRAYVEFLTERLSASPSFTKEALRARAQLV